MNDYSVEVIFNGYTSGAMQFDVTADSEEDAVDAAIEEAKDELVVVDMELVDEGEYEVQVQFGGMIGIEETYDVEADSEDGAETAALEEAGWDLEGEVIG